MSDSELTFVGKPPGDLARLREEILANPLRAAPSALRHAVWRLWAVYSHLFPSPLPIAAALGVWVRGSGLSEPDALSAIGRLMDPGRAAEFRFAGDLMAALAVEAHGLIRRRRNEAEAAERKRSAETPRPKFGEMLAESFRLPRKG